MAKIFKGSIRVKSGGTYNETTDTYTGGVTLGHFLVEAEFAKSAPMLEAQMSNGPLEREVDDDSAVAEIRIRALADSVQTRNFLQYAVAGGYCDVTSISGISQAELDKFGPWQFSDAGHTTGREAAVQTTTLVGTNKRRVREWIEAQSDLPDA